ncbi:MAG: ethanolamine utilization protein EutQ [Pseudomonadota bacterium]
MSESEKKSPARVMRWANADFQPRFEYGDQAQAAHLCGDADGSELGAGLVRLTNANIPWTVKYDEIILVLEGTFTVRTEDDVLTAGKLDSIWLPAGTKLNYEAEEALLFYAIHPSNWASKG